MIRRNFIRLAGGGVVVAAVGAGAGVALTSEAYPAEAVEAWRGPGVEADARRRALAYAITAPNPHNLQPWLVDLREPDVITLTTDRQRVLPETDPFGRQILIGHGAFIELLAMALQAQGLQSRVELWPQGEMPALLNAWDNRAVARIYLTKSSGSGVAVDSLFKQVLNRRSPKSKFDAARPITPDVLLALTKDIASPGIKLGATIDATQLAPLRLLCQQGAKAELLKPGSVLESQRLMRVGPTEILQHCDGITLNSRFVRALNSMGMFDRATPPAEGSAAYNATISLYAENSNSAAGFVWLSTPGNSRSQQIEAGRAFVRLQLKATELGLGLHPMSQALQEFVEMKPSYEKAHQLMLGKPAPQTPNDETLQMFCRLGYTAGLVPATPRRQIDKFTVTT